MKSSQAQPSWPALLGLLLLILVSPIVGRADERGLSRPVVRARGHVLAKPLSAQDGEAVRAQVGRRCRLTLIDGSTREGVVSRVQPGAWIKLATPAGPDETLSWRYLAAVSPLEPVPGVEPAPPLPAAAVPLLAHRGQHRAIYLRSGQVRRGIVTDLLPGEWLKLRTEEGRDENISWADIDALQRVDTAAEASPRVGEPRGASPTAEVVPPTAHPGLPARPRALLWPGASLNECTTDTPLCRIGLRDGSVLIGRLVEVRPGESRTLRLSIGTTRELLWQEVGSAEAIDATTATLASTPPRYASSRPPMHSSGASSVNKEGGVTLLVLGGIGVAVGIGTGLYAGIGSAGIAAGPGCSPALSGSVCTSNQRTPDYSPIVAPAAIGGVSLFLGGALLAGGLVLLGSDDKQANRRH